MKPTVLLFDIDGTLVSAGGAGSRAMKRGFNAIYGASTALEFRFDGMTDRGIVRSGLEHLGVEATNAAIDQVLEAYLGALAEEVDRVPDEKYIVHSGVRAALRAGRERGAAIGLGTGNIRAGARVKLERVGLFAEFAFGGFGCDAEARGELIRIGAERGAQAFGLPVTECRVVVIGDTPKDVAAALSIGAECIGVGTGSYSAASLLESGATAAFASLDEPAALEALTG